MASNYFRKVLALVLALLMVFVFSSCNKQSDNTSSQSDSSQTESASSDVKDTSSETDGASSKIDDASSEAVDSSSKAENTSSENDRTSSVVDNSFNNSSNTVSVPETIVTETGYVFNGVDGSAMFDGRRSTHWFPDTYEKTVIEFSSLEPKTFDALKLVEFDFLLKEFILEIKVDGKYVDICRLDEMGNRTAILDETYTASEFRLTVSFSSALGGVTEIDFITTEKIEGTSNFINSGYFCTSSLEKLRKGTYDKLGGYTDIILFDYGCWNEKGEFRWGAMSAGVDENHLVATLDELRALPQCEDLRIWFCLQNYDKKNITDVETLFVTEESREKLSDFAVELCEKYGFYGIDIDYEYPNRAAWANYDKFLSLCADKLHNAGYKLSCAFSPWGIVLSQETIEKIDYVNIMSYDYFGAGDDKASNYKIGSYVLSYFTNLGFKPQQLVFGIPYYLTAMEGDHPQAGGYDWAAERWRSALKPWVNMVTNKTWTYYFKGANMVRDKTYFAMENKFAGVFTWSMRNDVANDNIYGIKSLGQTVQDTIKRFAK